MLNGMPYVRVWNVLISGMVSLLIITELWAKKHTHFFVSTNIAVTKVPECGPIYLFHILRLKSYDSKTISLPISNTVGKQEKMVTKINWATIIHCSGMRFVEKKHLIWNWTTVRVALWSRIWSSYRYCRENAINFVILKLFLPSEILL